MTTKAEREPLMQGQDTIANAAIGFLVAHGWSGDYIIKNTATKKYGPNQAEVWVELDSVNRQYHVTGRYESAGENALSGILVMPGDATPAEVECLMAGYLEKAESRIAESFAGRFLTPKIERSPSPVLERIGERRYEFPDTRQLSEARAIYARCLGDQNDFESQMAKSNIVFSMIDMPF